MRLLTGLAMMLMASSAPARDANDLGWMAGDWVEAGGGRLSEESWLPPRAGRLIGMSRSGKAAAPGQFEFMRIEAGLNGGLDFIAQPNGARPSAFHMSEQSAASITFTNPAHDYPQRIRYWRDGALLMAEVSLKDGSRAQRWRYQRRQ